MKNYLRQTLILACLLGSAAGLFAQQIEINGSVRSPEGEGLPGATVLIKGSQRGVTTLTDGSYRINADTNDILVFSFIGSETREEAVNGRGEITVTLSNNNTELDEVVVIGYGSVRKSDLTGSVSSVKTENLQEIPSQSIDKLLQGRSAGLQVITSDSPGASSTIRIRGGSSLRGDNAPLVVVDGFPIGTAGNLTQINPADIISMEILKDASASAIYGSRGANGVIIITTRKAKNGETHIDIRSQTTLSRFTSELNTYRDPVQMALLSNEERINGIGYTPLYIGAKDVNGVYYPSVQELETGAWPYFTDWSEVVFRDRPVSTNNTVSVSSSSESTSYDLSMNYFTEQGIYQSDDYSRLNAKLGITQKLFENMSFTNSTIVSKGLRDGTWGTSYNRNPIFPIYDEEGDYFLTSSRDFYHPVALRENVLTRSNSLDVITSGRLDWKLFKNLTLSSQLNYKHGSSVSDNYQPAVYTYWGDMNNGAAEIGNFESNYLVNENTIAYKGDYDEHQLNIVLGFTYEYYTQRTSKLEAFDFVNETLQNQNLSAGDPELNQVSNGLSESKLVSGLSRINYSLHDRYLMTVTGRVDGSSKFGDQQKYAFFPSGALSWKIHREPFMQGAENLDQLKIRVSYGVSGNQGISPYQTLSRYGNDQYYVGGDWKTGIGPGLPVSWDFFGVQYWGGMANPNLKWETTAQSNLGLDIAFLDRRINMTMDAYYKRTRDLLREKFIAPSSGFDKMWINDGEILNMGFEVMLDLDLVRRQDFNLSAVYIFSKNINEVLSLGNAVEVGLQEDFLTGMLYEFWGSDIAGYNFGQDYANILGIGKPVNAFYGYRVTGIIQEEGQGLAAGLTGAEAMPGEFLYADLSEDGEITVDDREIIGDPNPTFLSSLALNASYKNFTMEIFLNGVFGMDVFNTTKFKMPSDEPLRWTIDNPSQEYPSLRAGRQIKFSDYYIQRVSFIRVQNINVGYNFSLPSLDFFSNGRVYINASNPITFTKFEGYDPEVGLDGIYGGGIPKLRRITFGVDLKF